jgi:hypothetical protein
MAVTFVIEQSFESFGRAIVFARATNPSAPFSVGPGARLGGHAIEPWLDIPRVLGADGQPRTDLVAFQLTRCSDRSRLNVGDCVDLDVA